MRYLTPACVRNLGTGLPLDGLTDTDIAGLIEEAEALIDSEAGLDERAGVGFASGTHTEAQAWDFATRRVYPASFPVPVLSVQSFEVVVSKQQGSTQEVYATIDPTLVIIQNDEGYLEVLSLALALYSLAPVLTQLGLVQPFARFTYAAGYSIQQTSRRLFPSNELLGAVDPVEGEDTGTLNLWHSRLPCWDDTQPVTVTQNGATLDPSLYTVSYDDGAVALNTSYALTDVVRASFVSTIPFEVVQIAKGAFVEVAGEYVANASGLAAFASARSGVRAVTRRTPDSYTWRDRLRAYLPVRVVLA